jgi:hypothetical protein
MKPHWIFHSRGKKAQTRIRRTIVIVVFADLAHRMREIGRPDKIILLAVVIADEGQKQGADDIITIGVPRLRAVFIHEAAFGVAPWARFGEELCLHLFREMQ